MLLYMIKQGLNVFNNFIFKVFKKIRYFLSIIAMILGCILVHLVFDKYLLYWVARYNPEYFFNDKTNLLYDYYSERLFSNFEDADVEKLNLLMLSNFTIHPEDHQNYKMPLIGGTTSKLLVRGFGYCDQVNGVFARILYEQGNDVILWGLRRLDGNSPHTVIKERNSPQFYDFWINPVKFEIIDENYISGNENIYLVTNEYSRLKIIPFDFVNGFMVNEYSLNFRFIKLLKLLKKLSYAPPKDEYISLVATNASTVGFNRDLGKLYILARIALIKGKYSESKLYLSKMLANECKDYFCIPGQYLYSKL